MFWNRTKKVDKPLGVQLSIEINMSTLDNLAKTGTPPTIDDMSQAWFEYHCVSAKFGIAAINSINGKVLIHAGSDSCIYRDFDFDIKLPFCVGTKEDSLLKIASNDNFIFMSFEEVVIMAFPTSYIINSLTGKSLIDHRDILKNISGVKSEININSTSPSGEYNLPIISNLAEDWFTYENTVVKVMATLLSNDNDFPVELGFRTD